MEKLTIKTLGALGDGVAEHQGRHVFVPFALPDEIVEAEIDHGRADHVTILELSPKRQTPPCPHFQNCGGCSAQHMGVEIYQEWKRNIVVDALAAQNIHAPVEPILQCAPQARRRAVFACENNNDGCALGFHKAQSHDIVPLDICTVLVPEITDRLGDLQKLGKIIASGRRLSFKMTVLAADNGLDINITDIASLSEDIRKAAIRFCVAQKFARLTYEDELLIEVTPPKIQFGDVDVVPPAGAFLQAVKAAEDQMAALVTKHLKSSKNVVDLFCGSGTFALQLAKKSRVFAVEFDAQALNALDNAKRYATGLKPLSHERRDLFRRPLLPRELEDFTGAIFDPPRAGAEAQCKNLAKSQISKIAAVSCNPQSLAKDLKILLEGGYTIDTIVPIDQFLWSAHVEVVALLSKKVRR